MLPFFLGAIEVLQAHVRFVADIVHLLLRQFHEENCQYFGVNFQWAHVISCYVLRLMVDAEQVKMRVREEPIAHSFTQSIGRQLVE